MKKKIITGIIILIPLSCLIYYLSIYRVTMNLHVIDPGKFYRSAQLFDSELEDVISQYKIKTIINLRGSRKKSFWYQPEKKISKKLKINLVDVNLKSKYIPHPAELKKLLIALEKMPRPILIHCRSGADRTGLVSAIYVMEYMNKSKEEALKQLTPKYWHFKLFTPSKTFFIKNYKGIKWALNEYNPCSKEFKPYYDTNNCD